MLSIIWPDTIFLLFSILGRLTTKGTLFRTPTIINVIIPFIQITIVIAADQLTLLKLHLFADTFCWLTTQCFYQFCVRLAII